MMSITDHFSTLPPVPTFNLTSTSVKDGEPLPLGQWSGRMGVAGGEDRSPQLSWAGAPRGTKSYAVTVYDLDAPTGSGFWHWAVANIPADVNDLAEGAGNMDGVGLPTVAVQVPNDAREARFVGAVPPPGHGPHHLTITVHALDVEDIGIPAEGTPAYLGFLMSGHTLGRATIHATAETPSAG
jgi:Raf kinase inhibitor-like YbhB/YbcL family protein